MTTINTTNVRGADLAATFYREVLDASETLSDIEEAHGARTIYHLFYLMGAIVSGDHIDLFTGDTLDDRETIAFIDTLPSAQRWREFINFRKD